MLGTIKQYCNEHNISIHQFPVSKVVLCELIDLVEKQQVNFGNASGKILNHLIANPNLKAIEAATQLNLIQENNQELLIQWVDEVIEAMPDKVKEYKSGKKGLIGLFAGEVKKKSKGKADMQSVNQILSEKLK